MAKDVEIRKIVNVKVNGEFVDNNTIINGSHLCLNYCPLETTMSCPKILFGCENSIRTNFPFITECRQVQTEKIKVVDEETGETRRVIETDEMVVTKCKRYDEAIRNTRFYY